MLVGPIDFPVVYRQPYQAVQQKRAAAVQFGKANTGELASLTGCLRAASLVLHGCSNSVSVQLIRNERSRIPNVPLLTN